MSTFTQIYYQIVFSTKDRMPALTAEKRENLFRNTWGILKNKIIRFEGGRAVRPLQGRAHLVSRTVGCTHGYSHCSPSANPCPRASTRCLVRRFAFFLGSDSPLTLAIMSALLTSELALHREQFLLLAQERVCGGGSISAKRIYVNSRGRQPTEQRRNNQLDPERVAQCPVVRPFQGRGQLGHSSVGWKPRNLAIETYPALKGP